jgi:hypothetical protein
MTSPTLCIFTSTERIILKADLVSIRVAGVYQIHPIAPAVISPLALAYSFTMLGRVQNMIDEEILPPVTDLHPCLRNKSRRSSIPSKW